MKSIFLFLGFFLIVATNAFTQITFEDSFCYLSGSITPLPYSGIKRDGRLAPKKSTYFHTEAINSPAFSTIYTDLQLTQSIPNHYQIESLYRRFNPTNGNYQIGGVYTGIVDISKTVLVTISPEGAFIDALEVSLCGYHSGAKNDVHVMQWKIDENMKVTTYRIKPTQTTPIPWVNQASSFYGQRIDTEYQVTPQGQFVKLNEVKYVPQTYTYQYLADENSNFWDGNETRME